jgi:NADP-reducing hydrogenase subunit HndB
MATIKTLDDLKKLRNEIKSKGDLREKGEKADQLVQVKVAMATCGIASGAKEVMDFFIEQLEKRNIESVVIQTGCMGYCYAEPTVEVTLPGAEPVVFGYVNTTKADQIIEKYIKNKEFIEGIIPVNYRTI